MTTQLTINIIDENDNDTLNRMESINYALSNMHYILAVLYNSGINEFIGINYWTEFFYSEVHFYNNSINPDLLIENMKENHPDFDVNFLAHPSDEGISILGIQVMQVLDNNEDNSEDELNTLKPYMAVDPVELKYLEGECQVEFIHLGNDSNKLIMAKAHSFDILNTIKAFDGGSGYTKCIGIQYDVDDFNAKIFLKTSSHSQKIITALKEVSPAYKVESIYQNLSHISGVENDYGNEYNANTILETKLIHQFAE